MIKNIYQNNTHLEHYFSKKLGVPLRLAIHNDNDKTPDTNNWLRRIKSRQIGRRLLGKLMRKNNLGGSFNTNSFRFPQKNCSISHCDDIVVCMLSPLSELNGLGIDIELHRAISINTGKLLLSNNEQRLLKTFNAYSSEELLRLWTVKEALFKADMNNSKRGWLSCYECLLPHNWFGDARLRINNHKKHFKYGTVPFNSGYLSIAICY